MALDPDDDRAPYQQVAEALRLDIEAQRYQPGEKLPSRKELATKFNVAPMTVQNAIRELRTAGLIVSRQGAGVFVRTRTDRPADDEAAAPLRSRRLSITFDNITDEQYERLANGIWAVVNTVARLVGFSFTAKHDGDRDLSHRLNGAWTGDTSGTWE